MNPREPPAVMQPHLTELGAHAGSALSLNLPAELLAGAPLPEAAAVHGSDSKDVRVHVSNGDSSDASSSRRYRVTSHSHSRSQPHGRSRSQRRSSSEADLDSPEADLESEPNSSLSELRYLIRWLQKSFPFLIILCAKLVLQHTLGEDALSKAS